jgi:hypothetical protein
MATYRDPITGKMTLFISGHSSLMGQIAQVEVPASFLKSSSYNYSDLPVASLLQKFRDITNGDMNSPNSTLEYSSNGASSRGLLPFNGKLIYSAVNWYAYTQSGSHGRAAIDFTNDKTWSGFSAPINSVAPVRAVAGAMALTPIAWQSALGSPALTGASSVSVISAASFGPALSGFDPNSIGNTTTFDARTLLYYPQKAPVCGAVGCEGTDNPVFNLTSSIRGFATPSKFNSIVFVGTHGTAGYWYGGMTGPNGEKELVQNWWQGPHSTAYEYRAWLYKASDIALVSSGKLAPWEVKPYAIISLDELTASDPTGRIVGSAFDQESSQLFVATGFRESPKIHVYKIQ